jgi:hypothetical protein
MYDGSAQDARRRHQALGNQRHPGRKSDKILLGLLLWDALSLFSRLRESDRYRLFSAFDFTTLSTSAAFRSAPFIATHLAFDVTARARGIVALPFSLPLSLLLLMKFTYRLTAIPIKSCEMFAGSGGVPN